MNVRKNFCVSPKQPVLLVYSLHYCVFICMSWLMCVSVFYGDEGNRVVTKETHMFAGD